jgi:hypothetical protein
MRYTLFVCLFLCALGWAQNKPAVPAPSSPVADSAPVITIKGLCGGAATGLAADTTDNPCQTVITREAFEKLAAVIQANMTPESKRQLAERLPQLLVMTHQAEQLRLDQQDRFQKMIAYARLQILAQELNHKLQEKAAQVSPLQIEDYYHKNSEAFERATLERILIPSFKQPNDTAGTQLKPEEIARVEQQSKDEMAKEAERLRERAVAGEAFMKLQQDAYDAAGVKSPPRPTKLANTRRASLPAAHLPVFNLKPGEVSAVISDATGHYIYKLDSKETESLQEASEEIHAILQKQREKELMKELQASTTTELNPSYFQPIKRPSTDPATLAKPDSDPN